VFYTATNLPGGLSINSFIGRITGTISRELNAGGIR
jgi:hypothetical protein